MHKHRFSLPLVVCAGVGLLAFKAKENGDPVTVVIGPDGGAISAEDGDGQRLKLAVPPGAFEVDTTITLTPSVPVDDEIARFLLEPAGLLPLLAVQATFTAAEPLDDLSRFAWLDDDSDTLVDGTVRGSQLESALSQLGFPEDTSSPLARRVDPFVPEDATVLNVTPVQCDVRSTT